MDKPHKRSISLLGDAYRLIQEASSDILPVATLLPAHSADVATLVAACTSLQTSILTFVTTLQAE